MDVIVARGVGVRLTLEEGVIVEGCVVSLPFTCPLLERVGLGDSRFTTPLLVQPHTSIRLATSKITTPERDNHLIIIIEFQYFIYGI